MGEKGYAPTYKVPPTLQVIPYPEFRCSGSLILCMEESRHKVGYPHKGVRYRVEVDARKQVGPSLPNVKMGAGDAG